MCKNTEQALVFQQPISLFLHNETTLWNRNSYAKNMVNFQINIMRDIVEGICSQIFETHCKYTVTKLYENW